MDFKTLSYETPSLSYPYHKLDKSDNILDEKLKIINICSMSMRYIDLHKKYVDFRLE